MKSANRLIWRVLLFPLRLIGWLLRPVARLFRPLLRSVDSSGRLSGLIDQVSSSMATQRGLLLLIGTVTLVISLLVHGIVLVIMVSTASFDSTLYWLCIPFTLLHAGVLLGFTGTMLATPLGQGYRER